MNTTQAALSVTEFCQRYGISRSMFYKLRGEGQAPRSFHVGTRVLIPVEAAEEWCRARQGRVPSMASTSRISPQHTVPNDLTSQTGEL